MQGLTFLDSRQVTADERREAKRIGQFTKIVRPSEDVVGNTALFCLTHFCLQNHGLPSFVCLFVCLFVCPSEDVVGKHSTDFTHFCRQNHGLPSFVCLFVNLFVCLSVFPCLAVPGA